MKTITTIQGDTWDLLAFRIYGNECLMHILINANIEHRKTVIFPAGVVLQVPEIETVTADYVKNLPPWKQTGGLKNG